MKRSHSKVKQRAMVTHDVAPMPPIDSKTHCPHAAAPIASIANSFLRGCRGDVIGGLVAQASRLKETSFVCQDNAVKPGDAWRRPYSEHKSASRMLAVSLQHMAANLGAPASSRLLAAAWHCLLVIMLVFLSFATVNPAYSQTTTDPAVHETTQPAATTGDAEHFAPESQIQIQDSSDPEAASLDQDGTLSADDADIKRINKFSHFFPPQIRSAIERSRHANRKGPLMVFRHWAQERKPFVATFLFCLFFGLLGRALFPKQISVAQQCCRRQFWKCLGQAILAGITLITTVRILDLLLIANPLTTLLLALLELSVLAGLAVGVSLIGEGVARGMAKSNYLQTHPRLATFMKLCMGSLILAIIVQIPGAGLLPRIGIRIALLVAILGAGGLLKTKFGTQPEAAE